MRKKRYCALLALAAIPSIATANLTPENNLDALKAQIIQYHRSGKYQYDVNHIAHQALEYIQHMATQKADNPHKKLAIVLDIDETSLSNYQDLRQLGFGGSAKMQNDAEGRGDDSAIMPTLRIYQYALKHNISVFFITGRTEQYRTGNIKNLLNAGYGNVAHATSPCEDHASVLATCNLYMRDKHYLTGSAIPYKTAMRQQIEHAGYTIIANIGDQYSDLAGGYSLRTFKYPNYMYYVP